MINSRSFIQKCFVVIVGVCAIFVPGKKCLAKSVEPKKNEWDSMLLEDNKTYKCIPGSGPQHYVGQILKYRDKRNPVICTKVLDSCSLWKEVNE